MAANDELQTSRITVGSSGSSVDNNFRDVEAALRTIFGITADTDYSEAMQVWAQDPSAENRIVKMTGMLTLAGDPTEDLHVATKQYVDNNSGIPSTTRGRVRLTSTQSITDGNSDALEWDAASIEAGGDCWDAGDPTQIVFPVSGDYLIGGCIVGNGDGSTPPAFSVSLKLNGTTFLYPFLGMGKTGSSGVSSGVTFAVMEPVAATEYVEVFVTVDGCDHVISAGSSAWIMKVG